MGATEEKAAAEARRKRRSEEAARKRAWLKEQDELRQKRNSDKAEWNRKQGFTKGFPPAGSPLATKDTNSGF